MQIYMEIIIQIRTINMQTYLFITHKPVYYFIYYKAIYCLFITYVNYVNFGKAL